MTAQALQLATPIANIGLPAPKTVADLNADLLQLEQAFSECNFLVNERATRSYRVQAATTAMALGTGDKMQLQAAQAALDEAVEAVIRRSHLEQSIVALRGEIKYSEGKERREFCESVEREFMDLHGEYAVASKALLEQFRRLHVLHNRYVGLTNRPLLHEADYSLNLPTTRAQYDSPVFSSGTIVRNS